MYIYLNSPRSEAGKGLGARIPSQIADKLRGQEFSSFDKFRAAFWEEVSKEPSLAIQCKSGNLGNIKNGKAPSPRESEQIGSRVKYELHHVKPISDNGAVYDIDNIKVLTPKRHIEIHKEVK
ncbi:HNH endonuclease signature motif containing protein [Yersinia vastinensis]|uniref:HNH endonuclease signature motif containing protein n=1 Tax=Yersinia vastinensis TaxID=2890318 RepID=UPI001F29F86C|nr:HNH endonuclease signature motif containing protein [Yersinia vastinensis]